MANREDMHPGAAVYASDGRHVGNLADVLVKSEGDALDEIVVQETRMFAGHFLAPHSAILSHDVVVPLYAVREATHERIDLNIDCAAVRRLKPYMHLEPIRPASTAQALERAFQTSLGAVIPSWEEIGDKPAADLEIDRGENVMAGHSGVKLGTVDDVLLDGDDLVGIVVKPEGFFTENVMIPVRLLERSDDLALFVRLTPEELKQLQPFHPAED